LLAYESIDQSYFTVRDVIDKIGRLSQEIEEKIDTSKTELFLEDENTKVIFKAINPVKNQGKATVRLSIDNAEKTLRVGEVVVAGVDNNNGEFSWVVDSITSRRAIFKQIFKKDPSTKGKTETINLDEVETLQIGEDNTVVVQILEIDTKKQAYVTILPGSGEAISRSVVDVKIPIERRAIQFNTEQIDKQIDATKKIVEKLDTIIDKLDTTIKVWRTVCLSVFGFITLKNAFGGDETVRAQRLILRGLDGKSGFGAYCEQNSGYINKVEKEYDNYDECIFENQEYIKQRISLEKNNIKNSELSDAEYLTGYSKFSYGSDNSGLLISKREAEELELLRRQYDTSESQLKILSGDSVEKRIEQANFDSIKSQLSAREKKYEKLGNDIAIARSFSSIAKNGVEESERDAFAREAFNVKLSELSLIEGGSVALESLEIPGEVGRITFVGEKAGEKALDESGNVVDVTELKREDYLEDVERRIGKVSGDEQKKLESLRDELKKDKTKVLTTDDEKTIYIDDFGVYYYSETDNYFGQRIRGTYARKNVAEYYQNGRPYCVPTGNGNYVKVLSYFDNGDPNKVSERNVGRDGLLCTSDDIILLDDSEVDVKPEKKRELKQVVTSAGFCRGGTSGAGRFTCSYSQAKALDVINTIHCTDVMGLDDCRVLFNICDPVMCPTSRFNFGGRWNVGSVPETGIIGSLVLGMHNFGDTNVIPPVCLPGVQSGFEGIRSVFQGYEQCLQTSKTTGQTVGICDKVKSVFICENIWREAVSIIGTTGGLSSFESGFFSNNAGGGEYAPGRFSSALRQTGNSAKFFTSEYSTASLASFEGRSLGSAGGEVCRNIYAGSAPGIGKLINQITTPESPPQFTAFFDEYPWTGAGDTKLNVAEGSFSSKVEEQSRYSVFYHIYAGRANDVRYSVYLKDGLGNVAYVTERAGGRARGFIPREDFVSKNIDFIGRTGFTNLCVEINGKETCGFGRASTDFGLNFLADKAVENELGKEIKNKEQCVPENVAGPTLGGLASPTGFGDTTGGIVRVCSHNDPGEGGKSKWEVVGSCGEDKEGINLGSCWIDKSTIRINDEKIKSEQFDKIVEVSRKRKGEVGIISGSTEEEFEIIYFNKAGEVSRTLFQLETRQLEDKQGSRMVELVGNENVKDSFRFIVAKSIDYGALAQVEIGKIYLILGNDKLIEEIRVDSLVAHIEDDSDTDDALDEVEVGKEVSATGGVVGGAGEFGLCRSDELTYCTSEEGCEGKDKKISSKISKTECRAEREKFLTDSSACDNNIFSFWNVRDICHKRSITEGNCFYDSEPIIINDCSSCDNSDVQRIQCGVYKDQEECEKWDPCVFDCRWNKDVCISQDAFSSNVDLNNLDKNTYILYEDSDTGRLHIFYEHLNGNYFIHPDGGIFELKNGKEIGITYIEAVVNKPFIDGDFIKNNYPVFLDLRDLAFFELSPGVYSVDGTKIKSLPENSLGEFKKAVDSLKTRDVIGVDESAEPVEREETSFRLRYEADRLYIEHESLEGVYTILNEPGSYDVSEGILNAVYLANTYPIYEGDSISFTIGYVGEDGSFNIQDGKLDEELLERMNVDTEKIAEQFETEGEYEIYTLSEGVIEVVEEEVEPPTSFILRYRDDKLYIEFEPLENVYYIGYGSDEEQLLLYIEEDTFLPSNGVIGSIEKDGSFLASRRNDDSKWLSTFKISTARLFVILDRQESATFSYDEEGEENFLGYLKGETIEFPNLQGKIIVLDPGHGGSAKEATYGDIRESELVLDISNSIKEELQRNGATVFLTRDRDKTISLNERRDIANSHNPDLFFSIHVNDLQGGCGDGTETYVFCAETQEKVDDGERDIVSLDKCNVKNSYYEESLRAAGEIHPVIVRLLGTRNRGIAGGDFSVLEGILTPKVIEAPALLIETGFLCNENDRDKLLSADFQNKIAIAITQGANEFFA